MEQKKTLTAFRGFRRIASGPVEKVVAAIKESEEQDEVSVLIFDDATGRQVDLDLRGSVDEVAQRFGEADKRKGRGRPRMGVSCNEICLLPRHWDWLAAQPRSASATLRRLVEAARKTEAPEDRRRELVDAIGSFMWTMTGDLPGFEEASRDLYRGNWQSLRERISDWPVDLREYIERRIQAVEE